VRRTSEVAEQGRSAPPVPVSFAQERAWLEDRLAPGAGAAGAVVRLRGALDTAALTVAIGELADRHPALRTSIALDQDTLVQVISPAPQVTLDIVAAEPASAPGLASYALHEPFDLGQGPLLRARLIRASDTDHLLVLAAHRAIADESSLTIMLTELGLLYSAQVTGGPAADDGHQAILRPLAGSFPDYALAQRRTLAGGGFETGLRYWREQLAGVPADGFPAARPPGGAQREARRAIRTSAAVGTLAALRQFAAARNVRARDVLLAGVQVLIARYTSAQDAVTGVTVSARREASLRAVVGPFTDIVVLRTSLSGDPAFAELVARAAAAMAAAHRQGDVPFGAVVAALRPLRGADRYPLFGVGIDIAPGCDDAGAAPAAPVLAGLTAELMETTAPGLAAGLCLGARVDIGGELTLTAEYPPNRYAAEWVAALLTHWQTALSAGLADPATPVSKVPLLTEPEQRAAQASAQGIKRHYPDQPIHKLIAQQAARTPQAVALSCAGQEMSYAGLAEAAGTLAAWLRGQGTGPGSLVGLLLDRNIDLVVAVLGVLGAGAGFLPLDTTNPPERIAMIVADAGTEAVLTTPGLRSRLPASVRPITGWPRPGQSGAPVGKSSAALSGGAGGSPPALSGGAAGGSPPALSGGAAGGPSPAPSGDLDALSGDLDALCYVIFTSGSTGRPKGVATSHRNLVSFVSGLLNTVGRDQFRRTLFSTPLNFDACLVELWPPLVTGGTLVICDGLLDVAADPAALDGVTLLNAVPSVLAEFLRTGAFPASLKTLTVGAEPLPGALVRELFQRSPARDVYNMYGPTETTGYATMSRMPRAPGEPAITIGRPIDNVTALILDRYGNAVPTGVPGEMFLGGPGVAIGYWRQPELTEQRFLQVSAAGGQQRMYRTGDSCRRRADGEMEFLGRLDDQVKVHGVRIELGDVEAALARHPAVRAAVAAVRENPAGQRCLVGYFVTDQAAPPSSAELAAACRRTVPPSLVPEAFVPVAEIPRSATGKANRRALPGPPWGLAAGTLTGVEHDIAQIWCALLGRERVSRQDSFFELGGSSLLAVRMAEQVGRRLGVNLPPDAAWSTPTLAALAREIGKIAGPGTAVRPEDSPDDEQREGLLQRDGPGPRDSRVVPRTATEREVATVYADVLGIPRAGALDDFFDLGGTSLQAAVAIGRIRHQLGVTVPMADFIVAATVEDVAQLVEEALLSQASPQDLAAATGGRPPDRTISMEVPDHG
jgi:amino acid adenylation domain-containing protein